MKTFIVIVNYRTAALTVECLASVAPQRAALRGGTVLVVDNASGDGSAPSLRQAIDERGWQDWVELLEMPRNGGFSYGNNAGLRRARALNDDVQPHVLLLNPDTVLKPGCLADAVAFLETNKNAGIVGVPICGREGRQECSGHRWPTPVSELIDQARLGLLSRLLERWDVSPPPSLQSGRWDWISGAFFLIRNTTVEEVGELDEGYFLYFEEVDYCRRAARRGWEVWQASTAGIVHLEGASTGIVDTRRPRPAYWFDSRRRYFLRARGWTGLLAADLMSLAGRALFLSRRLLGVGQAIRHDNLPRSYHQMLVAGDLRSARSALCGGLRGPAR